MDQFDKSMLVLFKAMGNETRLEILHFLRNGEKCACKLLNNFSIAQPTLSHHMKILVDAGLVIPRREEQWVYYSLSPQGKTILEWLDEAKQTDADKSAD